MIIIIHLLFLLFFGCQSTSSSKQDKKEKITRNSHSNELQKVAIRPISLPSYPFKEHFSLITKGHFECKGSYLNPPISLEDGSMLFDCNGNKSHSLPIIDNEEWVCPLLLQLMNEIQSHFKRKVIITSGHRCPKHHLYLTKNKDHYSKHQIAAQCTFYVEGYEGNPEAILDFLFNRYKNNFQRFSGPTDVSLQPWTNNEIFIKLYNEKEGRDLDNEHPYPYLSIQVKREPTTNQRITYDNKIAYKSLKLF
jgi:hypothetical protein